MYAMVLGTKKKSVVVKNVKSEKISYFLTSPKGLQKGDVLKIWIKDSFFSNGRAFFKGKHRKLNEGEQSFEQCLRCEKELRRRDKPLCYQCWSYLQKSKTDKAKDKKSYRKDRNRLTTIYREVLKKAWEDGIISNDEAELLNSLRANLDISEEEHQRLEIPIKREVQSAIRTMKKIEETNNALENDFRKKFPPEYRTKDGHIVRSKAERSIDNWLYEKGIVHCYEKKLRGVNIYCDFYIPYKGGIYVEYWGMPEQKKYRKRMIEKRKFYKKRGLSLIEIFEQHMKDPSTQLPEIFGEILDDVEQETLQPTD